MNNYYCKMCSKNIDEKFRNIETNTCLECKSDDLLVFKSEVFWCDKCNVPYLGEKCDICDGNGKYIASDLRPVFLKEQFLLNFLMNGRIDLIGKSVWHSNAGYIVDGKRIKITKHEMMQNPVKNVRNNLKFDNIDKYISKENEIVKKFVLANKNYIKNIEIDSMNYINSFKEKFNLNEMFISFSGGKDSTVITNLVEKTFSDKNIIKIFGDTTLEYPQTYEYINDFSKENAVLKTKNKTDDFYKISEGLGPPSQTIRWCCTFFKTTPISDKVSRLFSNKHKILSFQGIRRSESSNRSKYLKTSVHSKIKKQTVASPIIDWIDLDVWLYILANDLKFNEAYEMGFARVGCWLCPNNSPWEDYLARIYFPEISNKWDNILYEFSDKIGKTNIEDYIINGRWKARKGGEGLEISRNIFLSVDQDLEKDKIVFVYKNNYSDNIIQLFKPFGDVKVIEKNDKNVKIIISDKFDNVSLVVDVDKKLKKIIIKIQSMNLGGISKKIHNKSGVMNKIENQLAKFQLCVGCNGCKSVCKYDAIEITKKQISDLRERVVYKINEKKCVNCGECIDHFDGGCYMKKVLRIKKGDNNGK